MPTATLTTPTSPARARRARAPRRPGTPAPAPVTLGRYKDDAGRERAVVVRPGFGGTRLVIDCAATDGLDARLLAHLGADEPATNAALVARAYLRERAQRACPCRPLEPGDLELDPYAFQPERLALDAGPLLCGNAAFRLGEARRSEARSELRWLRIDEGRVEVVSLREVVGCLQQYEPACSMTRSALGAPGPSTGVLRQELGRVCESAIVLNRGLREAVLSAQRTRGVTMSEIAIRCGRVKRDRNGNVSGETSWLARRVGLLPEGCQDRPTPWVHSRVLALIARRGLGISPREAEV